MKMKIILAVFLFGMVSVLAIQKDQVLSNNQAVPNKEKGGNFHNSIGLKVDKSMVLDSFPFKVTRCDQIVMFPAKYISDMGDYRFRKDGFFSLTAYYVNQFREKDAKKLDESILLTESKNVALHLKGARGCIYIDGGKFRNDIAICLANKVQAQNILNVMNEFERCRLGDNLQPIPIDLIRKLIRACGKKGKWKDPSKKNKKGNTSSSKKYKRSIPKGSNAWREDRKRYFHPLKLRVPGTRR